MGFLASAIAPNRRALNDAEWLRKALFGGARTATGRVVGVSDAMKLTTVFACVTYLTETIATLPLITYQRMDGGGRERAPGFYLYDKLHDQPNPEMTSTEFWETSVGHVELWGNSFAEIETTGSGRVEALWPLRPDRMQVRRIPGSGALDYLYTLPDGEEVHLPKRRVMHIRNISLDGIVGLSRIALAREAIALAMGIEEYEGRFFANNSRPGGVLEVQGKLRDSSFKNLKESWEAAHRGLENSERVAVLEEGVTWKQMALPARDTQLLENREFQREEIASIFRVPPHKVGILKRSTNNNIEQQAIEAVTDAIRPRTRRIEKAIHRDLLTADSRKSHFVEFLLDELLKGDSKSRNAAYAVGRQWGWLSANDVRRLENMNPIGPEGDVYLAPINMSPAELLGQILLKNAAPPAPADDDDEPDLPTSEDDGE